MTKEEFISISNKYIQDNNGLTPKEVVSVLFDFCMEKDSSKEELFKVCIGTIINNGTWSPYFEHACQYFNSKFNVCLLYSEEREVRINTPLGPQVSKQRILLRVL